MSTSRVGAAHQELAHHFADMEQQQETSLLGMWVFLSTELMVFGALFTGYAVYRERFPSDFAAASNALSLSFAAINTAVLLGSSLTMALAVHACAHFAKRRIVLYLLLTAGLGTLFLVIKAFEYYHDYQDKLVPVLAFNDAAWANPGGVKLFLAFYYIMTGLHALHLTIGIVVMLIMALLAQRGRFTPEYNGPVEIAGLYWHFVDVVWIFLLPLLYMSGVRLGW